VSFLNRSSSDPLIREDVMHRALQVVTVLAVVTIGMAGHANADEFQASFSGFDELGALNAETGAILSGGAAKLTLKLDRKLQSINYTLTFSNLSAPVTQAHIHFGKHHVPGGVMAFLCSNLMNGPAGTPICPAASGTVTGTITPASVVGPTAQNVTPGDFAGLVRALEADTTYGNIHTTKFPAGEIRGEIREVDRK
jgi:hypothetical protein